MSIQFASRGPAWFHQWAKAGTVTSQCAEIKRSRGVSGRMSHLQTQLHCFRLLSTQSHSAHWGLQLGHRDAGLIHLAEVQGLELQCRLIKKKKRWDRFGKRSLQKHFFCQSGLVTFSLEMLSLLPMISAIRSRLSGRDSMAVKQSRAWQRDTERKGQQTLRILNPSESNTSTCCFLTSDIHLFICLLCQEITLTNLLEDMLCRGQWRAVEVDADSLTPFQKVPVGLQNKIGHISTLTR